jgi:hypothetical protein
LLCQAATHGRTQLHAVAERLSISFGNNNWVCSHVSETPWLEPTVEAMCLWQTFISGQCVRNAKIVANIPLVSPSLEPTTLAFPRSRSMIDDDRGPQVFKSVNFFSLPPLVSRSSTHFSQLISQIVQKRPKSGLRAGHSEVFTSRHVVWTDSIPIEPNQRKKYKLASLLSGFRLLHTLQHFQRSQYGKEVE